MFLGTVRGPGFKYNFNDGDLLWAARSARCESSNLREMEAVLWTMLNRFVARKIKGVEPTDTFGEFIRTFSQPVNPRYTYSDPDRVQRRVACQTIPLSEIEPEVVDLVRRWMRGGVPAFGLLYKTSDFAARDVPGQPEDLLVYIPDTSHNLFYIDTALTANWSPGTLTISAPSFMAAGVGMLTVLLGLGMILSRRKE